MTSVMVRPASIADIPALTACFNDQQERLARVDRRLDRVRSASLVEHILHSHQDHGLVAIDEQGKICGYVQPGIWELAADSLLHAFLTARNGVAHQLYFPDPGDQAAPVVLEALLQSLTDYWRVQLTTGDLIRWPSCDSWLAPILHQHGFLLDSVCALASPSLLSPQHASSSATVQVRQAQPADEERLVSLFQEEIQFHEAYIPFARTSPAILQTFRQQLTRSWSGATVGEGAPLVLVVEQAGQVVAMVEATLMHVSVDDEPGWTPPGQYCCIDNLSVTNHARGQGIGRLLVQDIARAFADSHIDGYLLWYNPANPLAARFWSRLGFQALWTTYQRLYSPF